MDEAVFLAAGVTAFAASFAGVTVGVAALSAIAPMSPSAISFRDFMTTVKDSIILEYDTHINPNLEKYYTVVGNFKFNLSLTVA